VPVPPAGSSPPNFCRSDGKGSLIVRVKNQGSTPAPASNLRVTFSTLSGPVSADIPTPPLGGGAGLIDLSTPIPPDCLSLSGGCQFQIAVDVDDAVLETDESNNIVSGVCAAPVP
jgi:subtilase family serine protease